MWTWIWIGLVVMAVLYGLHRAATWAERRGWVYYRTKDRPRGGMSLIGQIYHPSIEYTVEEEQSQRLDQDESGDPETPGEPDRPR
ncbi:MAG: hypothetical protein KJO84_00885 [Acidimicrobiia bacterium]|nr:hypothetical protein [Acidimicrobiia bacterium]